MVGRWFTRALLASINSASTCLSREILSGFESQTGELDTAVVILTLTMRRRWFMTGESVSRIKSKVVDTM